MRSSRSVSRMARCSGPGSFPRRRPASSVSRGRRVLRTPATGRETILASQRSGMVFALDPEHAGEVLWQLQAAAPDAPGGIAPGAAADHRSLYVPLSGLEAQPPNEAGSLTAVDIKAGTRRWHIASPTPACSWGEATRLPACAGASGHGDSRRGLLGLDGRAPAGLFDHRRQDSLGLRHGQGLPHRESDQRHRRLAAGGRRDHRERRRVREFRRRRRRGSRATCCSLSRWTENRKQDETDASVLTDGISRALLALGGHAAVARRAACRERAAGHRELRGQDFRHHALSGSVQALDQAGADGSECLRRGHRGQAHIDQRPRGALRDAGASAGQRHGRQAAGDRRGRRARHRSRGPAARRRRRFSTRIRRCRARASCRGSRTRCSPTAFRPAAPRSPSPRASCRASSSSPTTSRCRDCAFKSMPRSIPATAAARRSPATR